MRDDRGKRVRLPFSLLALLCVLGCCVDKSSPPSSDGVGIIQGMVRDASTNIGIQNAQVVVRNTSLQASTDNSGKYQIRNVAVGTQTIEASANNYSPQSRSANVTANSTTDLDFSLTPSETPGNIYYVSAGGNNSNPGSQSRPWATPGYGSRQLKPGDTLVILEGKYVLSQYDDDIITPVSGLEDAWITIKGEEGKRPVLAGRNNLLTAVHLSGANFVRLENLEITHDTEARGSDLYFRDAVRAAGAKASQIILKDLYIHHIDEMGVDIQDIDGLQVVNCRIEYCGSGSIGGPEAESSGWRNALIQNCRLSYGGHYYRGQDGSNRPYDRPDGFGVEPSDGPIEIVETVAEHNYGDGLDSKPANTTIKRCIVANNSCDGIKLWAGNSRVENTLIYGRGDGNSDRTPWAAIVIKSTKPDVRFDIVNVTIDDALGGNYLIHVQYDLPDMATNLTLRNVIFCGRGLNSPIFIGRGTKLTAEYNLFYLPKSASVLIHGGASYTDYNLGNLGPGNIYADPKFIQEAWGSDGDYHLRDGSPAIDAGSSTDAPSGDLEGTPRPKGKSIDIGAYEK